MITPFQVYLVAIMDGVLTICAVVGTMLSGFGVVMYIKTTIDETWDESAGLLKYAKRAIACGVVFFALAMLNPGSKGLAAMIIIPRIVNSETAQKLPAELSGLALSWIQELRPEASK